jgi:multicomponent Na+:H+ antiporter subunit C
VTHLVYYAAAAALIALGAFHVFASRERLRQVLAINIMGTGVFLLLVTRAWTASASQPDPIPQALVLTGLVVAAASTGLALALGTTLDGGDDASS